MKHIVILQLNNQKGGVLNENIWLHKIHAFCVTDIWNDSTSKAERQNWQRCKK